MGNLNAFHKLGLWVLLMLTFSVLAAQTGGKHCNHAVYGIVSDSETREPLVYAKVYSKASGKGTITGLNGEYRIEGLCDGKDTIWVSHIGCGEQSFGLEVAENTHFDILLPHSQSHGDTVHIHDKHPGPKPTQAESSLSGADLDKQAGKSLGEALKEIAGVTALQTGPSIYKPIIQGMHSNRIVIMNNGVRQESQQWGSEHAPEIDPFTARKISVIKGAAGVRYGPDAIAGVILVEPGDLPDSSGVHGSLHLLGNSNGRGGGAAILLEGRPKALSALAWRAQASWKRAGNVHTPGYILANTALKELNGSAALAWTKERYGFEAYYSRFSNDIGIFSGSHIGNLTDLQTAIASDTPLVPGVFSYEIGRPKQHIVHDLIKAKAWMETGHAGILSLVFSQQFNLRQEFDNHRSSANPDAPQLHYEIATTATDLVWEHEKFKGFRGMLGLSGQTQVNEYQGFFFIPNFRNYNGAAFWMERLVKLRCELEMGLRYDYRWNKIWMWQGNEIISPERQWQNLSGTFGGLWRIDEHMSLHGNVSTAWRPPSMNELYSRGLHHGSASYEIGDSTLDREQAISTGLSWKYRGHGNFNAEMGIYHNLILGYIYQEPVQPATLTIRGAFPTFRYRQVDARFYGLDLAFDWEFVPNLSWKGKAALVRAQELKNDQPLIFIPPDRFESGLGWTFRGGKYFHQPELSFSAAHCRKQDRVPAGLDYADSPAAWTMLNASLSSDVVLGQFKMNVGISAFNLSNTRYRDYLNRFRYFADEMGRNYSLRIKIPF